jgi:anaerobic selenocysteine-containing dehydrogenase
MEAAPDVWAELSAPDAEALGVAEGDVVDVVAPRGRVRARARISEIREGTVFVPFHYGYWDENEAGPSSERDSRAANELTRSWWDPASKQPMFKTGAVRVTKVGAR